ncbi:MAG: NAD(P)-dependent oxidoreductase [Parcubacteria group bacterium]|nr:NAD(P)-dependent oxidoreductase [Parcubacteria group bacterium]
MNKKTRVLVTGACGFVGSHLVDYLIEQDDYEVCATDLPYANQKYILPHLQSGKVYFYPADLTKRASLKPIFDQGIHTIFHTAAWFNPCVKYKNLYKVNVGGTGNLCALAQSYGVFRFINWGSSAVYGCWGGEPAPKSEDTPIEPKNFLNAYAKSKFEQEQLALDNHNLLMTVVSLRPGNIYGPRTPNGLAMPLKNLYLKLLSRPPAFKGQEAYTSHVHVKDVVRAAVFLSKYPGLKVKKEIFNIAEDEPMSTRELFQIVSGILERPIKQGYENPKVLQCSAMAFRLIAGARNFFAGTLLRNPYNWYPLFDKPSVNFMVKHHVISNQKLRGLGFEFSYKIRDAIGEVIKYHIQTQWKEIPWFSAYKVR